MPNDDETLTFKTINHVHLKYFLSVDPDSSETGPRKEHIYLVIMWSMYHVADKGILSVQ